MAYMQHVYSAEYLRWLTAFSQAATLAGTCGHSMVSAGAAEHISDMVVDNGGMQEGSDVDLQDEVYQCAAIDIDGELVKRACEAAAMVARAMQMAEFEQLELASLHHTLKYIVEYMQHSPDDNLELFAARALNEVEDLLRQQAMQALSPLPLEAVKELKSTLRHAQDIAVLACSRFIDQRLMHTSRIPTALGYRFQLAFAPRDMEVDQLYARLGNAYHKLFNQEREKKTNKKRHGRGGSDQKVKSLIDLAEPWSIDVPRRTHFASCSWHSLPSPVHIFSADLVEAHNDGGAHEGGFSILP